MNKQTSVQFFYNKGKISNLGNDNLINRIFRTPELSLAELKPQRANADLLMISNSGSVLEACTPNDSQKNVYSAYGYSSAAAALSAFNGEYLDDFLGNYILGSYRTFSTNLMRFQSPDNQSPFDNGGINAYAYCQDDPINNTDPSGHFIWKYLTSGFSRETSSSRYGSATRTIRTYAEVKHRSLSKNEYKATKNEVTQEHRFLTYKFNKYRAINAPNHGQKTLPGNTRTEKSKLQYYESRLNEITKTLANLNDFTEASVNTKTRYFTKENHRIYLDLLTKDSNPIEVAASMMTIRQA
ncbi:RHS repeat-associated core domain-containing protein [Pseudomonas sp. NBRC 111123]|uniref:RHS repeat-associated core domain-containing protein n=1 Tax=Pseudomonas sp. NBRC 111123 TaxID=1661038 RepID=UPI000AF46CA7|nr:RHS repeat-associated core domain-containing protein [Pseudomonas sp. NBRC 111123]